MNAWLSEVYGTGAGSPDIEKTAQALLIEKLAEAEGIDISGLSPEQMDELAGQVLEEDSGEKEAGEPASEEEVSEEVAEETVKEAQAKFEEADFLGRVMAHSYTQELEKIASAGEIASKVTGALGRGVGHVKKYTVDAANQVAAGAKALKGGLRGAGDAVPGSIDAKAGEAVRRAMRRQGSQELAKGLGKLVLPVAGTGAVAYGAKKALEKEASAIEKLAQMQAAEILQANGIDPSTGAPFEQDEPATAEEAVDQRAVEILKEAGYRFQG